MLDEDALDKQTIERVFNVIRESQKITPYWRPVAPIIATQRGKVLYPLSVEVANALLRICACLDQDRLHDSFFSENLSLFTRYAQWLRARIVRGRTAEGKNFRGWHSEHVNDINKVHTWETSQVLLYLHSCEAMLQDHIARKALVESACKVGAERVAFTHCPPERRKVPSADWTLKSTPFCTSNVRRTRISPRTRFPPISSS